MGPAEVDSDGNEMVCLVRAPLHRRTTQPPPQVFGTGLRPEGPNGYTSIIAEPIPRHWNETGNCMHHDEIKRTPATDHAHAHEGFVYSLTTSKARSTCGRALVMREDHNKARCAKGSDPRTLNAVSNHVSPGGRGASHVLHVFGRLNIFVVCVTALAHR